MLIVQYRSETLRYDKLCSSIVYYSKDLGIFLHFWEKDLGIFLHFEEKDGGIFQHFKEKDLGIFDFLCIYRLNYMTCRILTIIYMK